MIDALLFAVRDSIRNPKFGLGYAECEITDGGKPPPRCGNWFVSVHDGAASSQRDNQLFEVYSFSITLTARIVSTAIDRVGDRLIARNIVRGGANKDGFNAKVEQLRAYLHMNWAITVLTGQVPNSANDNLSMWSDGTVYGFCEPMRWRGPIRITETPANWFDDDEESVSIGIKAEMRFEDCRRFQPQTAAVGPFV